jgi:peptide/nickel transport system permease protein
MRVTDAFLTFPIIVSIVVLELLLSIYTSAKTTGLVLGPGALVIKIEMSETLRFLGTLLTNTNPLMVSLILFGWMPFTRILNDQILITKRKEYVEAARSIGASPFRIIFKHLIPNSIAPVIVLAARDIGGVIVLQSSFTFIGLGGDAPWAQLLAIGRNWIIGPKSNPFAYWWVFLPATLIIILFGISWSLFGDVVNEWLNPSAKTREVI